MTIYLFFFSFAFFWIKICHYPGSLCLRWHWTISLSSLCPLPHAAAHDACSWPWLDVTWASRQQVHLHPYLLAVWPGCCCIFTWYCWKFGTLNEFACYPCGGRGHANLLCMVAILIYVLKKWKKNSTTDKKTFVLARHFIWGYFCICRVIWFKKPFYSPSILFEITFVFVRLFIWDNPCICAPFCLRLPLYL